MSSVYASISDLIIALPRGEQELIELTDTSGSGGTDDEKLERKLADTDSTIDTYLRRRYPLPLLNVPSVLRNAACDITRFALYGDAVPKEVKDRYDAAMRLLADLSTGRAGLPPECVKDAAGQPPAAGRGIRSGQARSGFDWGRYP